MRDDLIFSIIIPIYNAEHYIAAAIESVLRQSYAHWELILVDDGSPDASGEICEDYAKKDQRIMLLRRENGGLSAARNTGLAKAAGDYILFCDADDYFETNTLEVLANTVKRNNSPDIIVFGYYLGERQQFFWQPNGHLLNTRLDREYISIKVLPEQLNLKEKTDKNIQPFVWNKAYRTKVAKDNNIHFDIKYKKWEDKIFVLTFLNASTSIVFERTPLYHYTSVSTERLSTKYIRDTMLYVIEINKAHEELFGDRYELFTDYTARYYFDVITDLIIEALQVDANGSWQTICQTLDDPRMKKWADGVHAKNHTEELILSAIKTSDYQNIRELFLTLDQERKEARVREEGKQRSFWRRLIRKIKRTFS